MTQVKQIAKTGCNVLLIQKSILRDATTELCAAGKTAEVHVQSMVQNVDVVSNQGSMRSLLLFHVISFNFILFSVIFGIILTNLN